ncbi:hypothetical protein Adt_14582 [Abeliophyllum distichum]|uniref:DDE Tnp4 domain-containing protein n=1 Tax=Abeliophyllum distichum TaxID=126358 RepID=A0ABD1U012_9LAMI
MLNDERSSDDELFFMDYDDDEDFGNVLMVNYFVANTHSNNTIHNSLRTVCSFGTEIIRLTNQDVVHERILDKYPFFKDCIGAIDGTHIAAWAPESRQTSFRGRKTNITQNVMLVFDFDMKFSFVYTGWEGTANDSRVFVDAVTRSSNNFPMPLRGIF